MKSFSAGRLVYKTRRCESDAVLYLFLAGVVLLSYGYEIFNFALTIDEEAHAARGGRVHIEWIA
jgi:hypothetical protein